MTAPPPKPTRDEFQKFWQQCEYRDRFPWPGLRPYIIYLGILTLYTLSVSYVLVLMQTALPLLAVAGFFTLVIALPWIWIYRGHQWAARHRHFLWCPQCHNCFQDDINGQWQRPNPKWKSVAQTGHCPQCSHPILA